MAEPGVAGDSGNGGNGQDTGGGGDGHLHGKPQHVNHKGHMDDAAPDSQHAGQKAHEYTANDAQSAVVLFGNHGDAVFLAVSSRLSDQVLRPIAA